ncbi:uncharacterized protein LOC107816420 isoform X1 [Nicotiana tabacum]|uniref:Uncharacterized protein LOC107816420 isoform X1 n=1 Tax=Nicotiana tabacum TaxID=4097 RepID=A0AC58U9F0_TOBAC
MKKDDWLSAALSDDSVVVQLLFRLKHHPSSSSSSQLRNSTTPPPQPTTTAAAKGGLHLTLPLSSWGHRQPRSKPSSMSVKKAYTTTTRCSPITPLSWSGGAGSPSDDGYDESSRPPSSDLSSAFRSKGTFTNETSNISSSSCSKRSKKKRQTFTELKEEENLLLKERVHLKRELASIHVTLNEQRVKSDNFKRIKFDLNLQTSNEMAAESASNRCNNLLTQRADSVLSRHTMEDDDLVSSDSHRGENSTENQNRGFFLPDLNAMPSEDEICTLWN